MSRCCANPAIHGLSASPSEWQSTTAIPAPQRLMHLHHLHHLYQQSETLHCPGSWHSPIPGINSALSSLGGQPQLCHILLVIIYCSTEWVLQLLHCSSHDAPGQVENVTGWVHPSPWPRSAVSAQQHRTLSPHGHWDALQPGAQLGVGSGGGGDVLQDAATAFTLQHRWVLKLHRH